MKYEAKKPNRIKYMFMGFTTFERDWWYNEKLKQWENGTSKSDNRYSSHQDCRSVRAFRRKLKKCPKGIEFVLCSRWKGHDVTAVSKSD